MQFTKMQGLGNDFIITEDTSFLAKDPAELSRWLCNRNFGIGADGLVFLQQGDGHDLRMTIFNPDGSEAEMCGNAVRCVALYAVDRGLSSQEKITLQTSAGPKVLRVFAKGETVTGVEVDMGEPVLESALIPVAGAQRRVIGETLQVDGKDFEFTAVSMGNPHCVIFCPSVEDVPLEKWGPLIENNALFPRRTNVEYVKIVSPQEVKVRVWERGAGQTLACGTGSCAVVVAGVLEGKLERKVKVQLPGGTLDIEWRDNNHVYMTGPAEEVFRGEVAAAKLKNYNS